MKSPNGHYATTPLHDVPEGGERLPSRDYLLSVKLSVRQWKEFLGEMSPGRRSAYIRAAIEAYMVEHPVLRYIPVDEDPDEPIRALPTQAVGTAEIEEWLARVPSQIKSYLVRCIVNWYRQREVASAERQPTFFDEARKTGTDS